MQVTGWTDYENPLYQDWFELERTQEELDEAKRVIANTLRAQGYMFSGYYHQGGIFGVPVLDNKWRYEVSFRTWGGIMAMAYPDLIDNSDGMGYVEWAWIPKSEQIVPSEGGHA